MRGIFNGRERSFRSKPVRWSGPFVRVWFGSERRHPSTVIHTHIRPMVHPSDGSFVRPSVREGSPERVTMR